MDFAYVAKFVADMNRAVKFFRDVLGLPLKFDVFRLGPVVVSFFCSRTRT